MRLNTSLYVKYVNRCSQINKNWMNSLLLALKSENSRQSTFKSSILFYPNTFFFFPWCLSHRGGQRIWGSSFWRIPRVSPRQQGVVLGISGFRLVLSEQPLITTIQPKPIHHNPPTPHSMSSSLSVGSRSSPGFLWGFIQLIGVSSPALTHLCSLTCAHSPAQVCAIPQKP